MSRRQKEYAYYDRHDNLVDIGTKKELAERMGIKASTIEYYATPSKRKRTKEAGIKVIPIEEEEE